MNFAFHTSLVIRVNLDVYCGVVAQKKKKKKTYCVGVRIMARFSGAALAGQLRVCVTRPIRYGSPVKLLRAFSLFAS